jgi:hypothetical protein
MQTSLLKSHKRISAAYLVVFSGIAACIPAAAAEDIPAVAQPLASKLASLLGRESAAQ